MSSQEAIWNLSGRITYETVSSLLSEGAKRIKESPNKIAIDLSQVSTCDSSGVALCLEFLRIANTHNKSLVFSNPPLRMIDMIRVSGVDTILPMRSR